MFSQLSACLSVWMIPLLLLFIILAGLWRRVKVYEAFVDGAGEGFQTAVRIMPFLVAMMVAVNVFRVSGALELIVTQLHPVLQLLRIPPELTTLAVMRPLSGTGSLGIAMEILQRFGPDSLIGRMASTILGSTDTTFYILTVYFGAVGISKPRYSVFVGLLGDMAGFLGAVYICRSVFWQ